MNLFRRNSAYFFFILCLALFFCNVFSCKVLAQGKALSRFQSKIDDLELGAIAIRNTIKEIEREKEGLKEDIRYIEKELLLADKIVTRARRVSDLKRDLSIQKNIIDTELEGVRERSHLIDARRVERIRSFEASDPLSVFEALISPTAFLYESELEALLVEAQERDNFLEKELEIVRSELSLRSALQSLLRKGGDNKSELRVVQQEVQNLGREKDRKREELFLQEKKLGSRVLLLEKELLELESAKQEFFRVLEESKGRENRVFGKSASAGGEPEFQSKLVEKHLKVRQFYAGRLTWPLRGKGVSSPIVKRYLEQRTRSDFGFRKGVLLSVKSLSEVYSVGDGVVNFVGRFPFFGNTVIVAHGPREFSLYGNLDEILVKRGEFVSVERQLARVKPGSELYLELRRAKKSLNPESFLVQDES